MSNLLEQFGNIDIYLFDQLLRGRISPEAKILDAGCGEGRNLVYLLKQAYDVYGIDHDPQSIEYVRRLAATLAPKLPPDHFQLGELEAVPHADDFFDLVICNAVLHFADNDRHFRAMLAGCWRILKPGGIFFCRLASSIGMEEQMQKISGRRYALPDGSERYLVDARLLSKLTKELRAELIDPIKTTVVQDQRCMTTWIMRKTV